MVIDMALNLTKALVILQVAIKVLQAMVDFATKNLSTYVDSIEEDN